MTEDNITRVPGTQRDDTAMETDEPRTRREDRSGSPSTPEEQEPNPLLRDGPDAPDAADIEDPGEQL